MGQESHGTGIGKSFKGSESVAVTGRDICDQCVLAVAVTIRPEPEPFPQTGTTAICNDEATGLQFRGLFTFF